MAPGEPHLSELPKPRPFQKFVWVVGGICAPILCLSVELSTHMCRQELFDPLPTPWHGVMILTVPTATVLGMRALGVPARRPRWLGILLGVATGTTLLYTPPFVLLFPLSIIALITGLGLLSLAPLVAPIAMLSMAAEFRVRAGDPGGKRLPGMWTGLIGCAFLLASLDLRPALTTLRVQAFAQGTGDLMSIAWLREHADRSTLEELAIHGTGGTIRPLCMLLAYTRPAVRGRLVRENWTLFTGEKELPARVVRQLEVD